MNTDIGNINVLSELERFGIKYIFGAEDEVKVVCPFHADSSPSCNVNINKRVYHCPVAGCNARGDIVSLLARYTQTTRVVVLEELSTRYTISTDKTINPEVIERYHSAIWSAKPLLAELYKRGLDDEDIRTYRLGEHDGRITIPVPNMSGHFVNVRKYLPGAPGKDKMRNTSGHGEIRLFPIAQLQYPEILIVGGECKAIVAARELNQFNIGALCATAGEGNWNAELLRQLKGKSRVWVCLDVDEAGRKASNTRCRQLKSVAQWVGEVILPLDVDRFPKGDINDFKAQGGKLKPLLDESPEFVYQAKLDYGSDEVAELLELVHAIHANQTAKRVQIKSVVSSMDTSPYIVPKELEIKCNEDQKECAICEVFLKQQHAFHIPAESPAILDLVNAPKIGQLESVKAAIGIPRSCKACEFAATSFYNVEDARISPQLEVTNRSADRVLQPAFCIGDGLELNECYNLTGRMFPHPKTQQSTLLISGYTPTADALSTYKCDSIERLSVFWPDEWSVEGVSNKLDSIYADFEANVTRIFQRRSIHLAVDLAYHSPLFFPFDGKITKGWVECLILGDSAQGKSEVTCGSTGNGGLMAHYQLGAKVDCRNVSVAGLLGGLQKHGDRFFVSWGVIPTHDKRLVILEELKGASPEAIAKLTDMRSSGVAEIPKIEKRRTHARTRLVALSNPRSGLKMSQYNFGIEAIRELIGSLEDVRRFDFALLLSSQDIDPNIINALQSSRPQVEHTYTTDLCRSLILWGWTRNKDQVVFDPDAERLILSEATRFCEEYTDDIPLVDRGSMRLKLARLAASLAVRTFSCSEDWETLIVYPCHVEYVCNWLRSVYSSRIFGYRDFTEAMEISETLVDTDLIKKHINETQHPTDLVKQLLAKNKIDPQDLQDWCAVDRDCAQILLSFFVRKHALLRDGRSYRKSSKFIALLKHFLTSGEIVDRPPHIGEY